MTFEEAMRTELTAITKIGNKIYPLFSPEGIKAPYIVYRKELVEYSKTMDGFTEKCEANYEIDIITSTYSELQSITTSVIDKLKTFYGRNIGTSGPFIQNEEIKNNGDGYDVDVEYFVSQISLKVNY
jgi:hypothetical protein